MANRRGFGYGYGNPYGGRGNAYSGKGIITRRSPFSKPFVDYSKEMGARTRGWFAIHKEHFDKIDETIAANKAEFAKDWEDMSNTAVYEGGNMQGHQLDGFHDPDKFGGKQIAGESADLKGLMEDYREAWLASRGIRKKVKYDKDGNVKRTRLVGWAKATDTSTEALNARTEVEQIKGYIKKAGTQKTLYKELQNALYNDEQELGIISGHNDEKQVQEYKKFMMPNNRTRYDKKGNLIIIAEDGSEMHMTELAKMQPELRNAKLPAEVNKLTNTILADKTGKHVNISTDENGVNTYSVNQNSISAEVDAQTSTWKDPDYRDYAVNGGMEVTLPDGTVTSSNYWNSDESQVMQLIYQAGFENSKSDTNDINHGLVSGRDEKGGVTELRKHNEGIDKKINALDENDPNYAQQKEELENQKKDIDPTHGMKRKWINDHNFILDKDVYVEGSDAQNKLIESLKDGGVDQGELDKVINFLNSYRDPSGAHKSMPISNFLEHGVKRFLKNGLMDAKQNDLDKNQAAATADAKAKSLAHRRSMDLKHGPDDSWKNMLLVQNTLGDDPTNISIDRISNMLGGLRNTKGDWYSIQIQDPNDSDKYVPFALFGDNRNLEAGMKLKFTVQGAEQTTITGDATTVETKGAGTTVKTVEKDDTKKTKDLTWEYEWDGNLDELKVQMTNFIGDANVLHYGKPWTGQRFNQGLPGSN